MLTFAALSAAADESDLRELLEEQQQTTRRLEERLQELERTRSEPPQPETESTNTEEDNIPRVAIFDAIELDLGGFITQTLMVAAGNENVEVSPNATQLELLIRASINNRTTVFAALGWLREADLDLADPANPTFRDEQNRLPQIIAWANYRYKDSLQLRVGRLITPHGIINIEHFPPTLLDINQPQFLRPFSGGTIFPNFIRGAEVHGSARAGSSLIKYSAFGGVAGSSSNEWTFGGRAHWEWTPQGISIGLNGSAGARDGGGTQLANFSTVPTTSITHSDYGLIGADILINRGRLLWKNEIFYSFEDGENDRLGFYTQPAFRLT